MNQTKMASLIEATANTTLGFFVSFLVWPVAAYLTGISYDTSQHWAVIFIFTVSSVLRGYAVRRFFASGIHSMSRLVAKIIATK